jgi:hypothetical protein
MLLLRSVPGGHGGIGRESGAEKYSREVRTKKRTAKIAKICHCFIYYLRNFLN